MSFALGIDMGGTNLRFGLVNILEGKVTWSVKVPTSAGSGREEIYQKIKKGISDALRVSEERKCKVQNIGIGVPGCVDFERGFIYTLVNVPGWDNVPLAKMLEEDFSLPAFLDNDVNVMALGEYHFGAARDGRNVICLTLGTGVGGGVIVDGALYRGSSFTAGEIGHMIIDPDGPLCNCGGHGCLERYIGNRYLVDRAKELYGPESGMAKSISTPADLEQWAVKGDRVAKQVWQEAAGHLGLVLSGLVNFFNPDTIVIGGGVSKAGPLLFEPLERFVKERSMKIPASHVKIKSAELGDDAGLIGSCLLAKEGTMGSVEAHGRKVLS